jgi:hypothetical protein
MINAKMDYPCWESYISSRKGVQGHTGLYSMMGWDSTCQKAMSPRLLLVLIKC